MSVVIVKKEKGRILIGSDSQETISHNQQENSLSAKLREIEKDVYLGVAGDAHICTMLYAYAEKHSLLDVVSSYSLIEYFSKFTDWLYEILEESEENKDFMKKCQFIIVIRDTVWHFTDFYIREIIEDDFNGIGSGAQPALACLHLGASMEDALKATCKVNIYCSLPLKLIEINLNER